MNKTLKTAGIIAAIGFIAGSFYSGSAEVLAILVLIILSTQITTR